MKYLILFISLVLFSLNTFAQTPEKVSYQAVVRDNTNSLVSNSKINIRINIKQSSSEGSIVYSETHNALTNSNGLVSLQIGTGNQDVGDFSSINWEKGPYYIETQVDVKNNQNYSVTGVSEILSVPYALHAKSADSFTGTIKESNIEGLNYYTDADIDGSEAAFEGWDKNASDDFSGNYRDLLNIPSIYTKNEVDSLFVTMGRTGNGVVQSLILKGSKLAITNGNTISFEGWDTDSSDDFSGNYNDLTNTPKLFSGKFTDLINIPDIYTKKQVDSLFITSGNTGGGAGHRVVQSLNLQGSQLSISGGNSISFANWDTDASDDFSGSFKDLTEVPELYTKKQVDSLVVNLDGGTGIVQSLNLEGDQLSISGGNSISFANWDTDASDDFSGNYNDLKNIPSIYTKNEVDSLVVNLNGVTGTVQSLNLEGDQLSISGGNSISFANWDIDASDDFSGNYADLKNAPTLFSGKFTDLTEVPELYTKKQVDSLVINLDGGAGTVQSLNLEGDQLSISGGNSISFANWDTDASDDFSGNYNDLKNIPSIYTKNEVDSLVVNLNGGTGTVQSLNLEGDQLSISGGNSISFANWDINASDDFDGEYTSLKNAPTLFSGKFTDLTEVPELYTKQQVDSLVVNLDGGTGTVQSLNLEGDQLSISGGNSISFANWDTDASDDFSGNYADLKNAPTLFSGKFTDLTEVPELYTKKQVDSLVVNLDGGAGTVQSLNLEGDQLSISGGNSISFANWDTDASDDFSGSFKDLTEVPELYTKQQVDSLVVNLDGGTGTVQSLNLEGDQLSISGGNSISFANWDTDASDDFSGNYSDLKNAPKMYTQAEVDSIKAEILKKVDNEYLKKPQVYAISASRNISASDVGNTVACTTSATLTISAGFSAMKVGDVINIEVHGTTLTVQGSGVVINGVNSGNATIGNNKVYTGGILRKTGTNTYIVL